ncbi:MAG: hypothetical protein F4X89_06035 [Dehalococcoidia bacterium]|nr:hypothetical protein [Dehalococcoidia bacterium]
MPRRGRPRHPGLLTPGEQRVLEELRQGGTNAEIAVRLRLSPETVKTHIARMLSKLGLEDRHELASWRPESERNRLRALLAMPIALGSFARPLVWAGAGTLMLAGAAAVAGVLVFVPGQGEPEPASPSATPSSIAPTVAATPSPQPTPAATVSPTPPSRATPSPEDTSPPHEPADIAGDYIGHQLTELLVIEEGAVESLLLEWTGAPSGVTHWQYRYREWAGQPLPWSAWQAVPDSDAATRSYRVSVPPGAYEFEVRGVGPATVGLSSVPALEDPWHDFESFGISREAGEPVGVGPSRMVEGDGVTAWWVGNFTLVIPDGVRVFGKPGFQQATCEVEYPDCITDGVFISHHPTGSTLLFSVDGDQVERYMSQTLPASVTAAVNALFDQLIASMRLEAETPELMVISDGATDALILEWTGVPPGTTSWQYRLYTHLEGRLLTAGLWTHIPNSTASTRSYRLTGLAAGTDYEVEVRAMIGAEAGVVSSPRWQCCRWFTSGSITAESGRLPNIGRYQVIEGDGITKWRVFGLGWLVTIPEGMRVALVGGGIVDGSMLPVGLREIESNSTIMFDPLDGSEIERSIDAPPAGDVGALFDQIAESVEHR